MKVVCIFFGFLLISFFSAANSYTIFEENGKKGLKNAQGEVLIPAEYEALGWSTGIFSVTSDVIGYRNERRWGLISIHNRRITKAEFEELYPSETSLIIARKKSSLSLRIVTGCLNSAGKEVIPFEYDGLKIASLRAIVFTKIGNQYKYGLIDLENKTLIPQQYQDIRSIGTLRYAVTNFENKTAIFTDNGKQITEFTIDRISPFKKNYAVLYQDVYQGLIDREGQIKLEPKYREVKLEDDGTVKVREASEWLILDGQNKLIRQIRADSVIACERNLLKVDYSGKITLTDQVFKRITPSDFSFVGKFKKGKAIYGAGNQYGLIRTDGSVLLPATYEELIVDKNFILAKQRVGTKDSWTLLDTLGIKRMERTYEMILPFNGKFFAVLNRGFWGALNYLGQDVIACAYDSLVQGKDDYVVVKFRGQYGIINFKEEWVVTPQPNKIRLIGHDRYVEFKLPTTFLRSLDGNVIYFTDNKLEVHPDFLLEYLPSGTIWKIDMQGVIVDRQVYPEESTEKVFEASEGFRAIKRNGRFGFIDSQGRLRIANRYEGVQKFSEGLAPIKILGKWGFVNVRDNIAVQPIYEEVFSFRDGFALVKQKGFYGLIDKTGKQVLPVRYESIEVLPTRNLLIRQDGQMGLADKSGKMLITPRYHQVRDLGNGYAIVERDGKYGVVTLQGISTIPLMYDFIDYNVFDNFFMAMKKAEWRGGGF